MEHQPVYSKNINTNLFDGGCTVKRQHVMTCLMSIFLPLSLSDAISVICLIYSSTSFALKLWLPLSLTFFSTNFPLWEQFDAVGWSWCGWCEPCNPATLLQCPRLSLSGRPTPPPPSRGVLSEGQLLWTQTTVPFVLPGLGMHSAIFSCVSASPTGCQTCGPYSYASSSLSCAFFQSVCPSLWQCQCLSQWWRVLRRDHLCVYVIVNLSRCARRDQSKSYQRQHIPLQWMNE